MSNTAMRPYAGLQDPILEYLQAVSLILLVVVIAVRPLVSESYDSERNSVAQAVSELTDPSPARTLAFDLIILVTACIWLASFSMQSRRYRWTGLEAGFVILAIGGALSCYFAGNKRLAINGTVDWLCLPILAIVLTQLLDRPWRRNLVLTGILASACVNAAQCYEQRFLTFAETIQQYEVDKEAFWARQGVELGSPTVDTFERRLRSGEASGFFAHSNVLGAYLMLCALAGLGIIGSLLRRVAVLFSEAVLVLGFVLAWVFFLGIVSAVFLSGSAGATVAGGVGLVLLLVGTKKATWISDHSRKVFWICWGVVLLGIAAVIGHGLYHDSLPGWSLTFRWQYWNASAGMIADYFWAGVGRENFGRHYTLYKDIASPEEVSNPHNFLVQALAEWGVLGLLGVLAMLVSVTWQATRQPAERIEDQAKDKPRGIVFSILLVGVVTVLAKSFFLDSNDPNYLFYSAGMTALVWFPAALTFEQIQRKMVSIGGLLSLTVAAGLVAFLLQDLISFALFVPASATTFFALLAVWLSLRGGNANRGSRITQWKASAALCCLITLVVVVFIVVCLPVFQSAKWLAKGRANAAASDFEPAVMAFHQAAMADRLDPTPWVEKARIQGIGSRDAISQAIRRDPYNKSLYRHQSRFHLFAAETLKEPKHYRAAIESAKSALRLYPADPSGLAFLADTEKVAGQKLQSRELVSAAIQHYQDALAMDDRRLPWETIRRFHPRQVIRIQQELADLEKMLETLPP